jgi:hypothetical protein
MAWNFQKIVLTIAIILLICALIFIGVSLAQSTEEESWPPIVGDCPDYWVDLSGNGAMCVNTKSLGTCNIPTSDNKNSMDFSGSGFSGSNGTCAKYTWANGCGVTWDGVNSGIANPYTTTSSTTTSTT